MKQVSTPLPVYWALYKGHVEVTPSLIFPEHGTDLTAQCKVGRTPFSCARCRRRESDTGM